MRLHQHFAITALLAAALFPWYSLDSLLVFIGGFLTDIDHYIYGAVKLKIYSIRKNIKFWENNKTIKPLMIFHLIEFWILMIILSFFSQAIMLITFGGIVHIACDYFTLGCDRQWSLLKR